MNNTPTGKFITGLNFYTQHNQHNNPLTLLGVYRILNNPFYYGPFEYPRERRNWHHDKYPPLITQELFEKVQARLKRDKIVRENKGFAFTKLFIYSYCGLGTR